MGDQTADEFAADRAHALRTMFPQRAAEPKDDQGPIPDGRTRPDANRAVLMPVRRMEPGATGSAQQQAPNQQAPKKAGPRQTGRAAWLASIGVSAAMVVAGGAGGIWLATGGLSGQPEPQRVAEPAPSLPPEVGLPVVPSAAAPSTADPAPSPSGETATGSPSPAASKSPPKPTARANPSGVNLALNKTVTASDEEGRPWAAANAVDGDETTRWSSGFSDAQWLMVDLGDTWQLTRIEVSWEHAFATAYRLETSPDGRRWTTVFETSKGTGGEVTARAEQTARYVRLTGTKRAGQYGYSVFELRVR